MMDITRILPSKVCCCLEFDLGAKIIIGLIILLRFICMILGCLYGPYLYLVLPLGEHIWWTIMKWCHIHFNNNYLKGGLYLAADAILLYTIFGSGLMHLQEDKSCNDNPHNSPEVTCDFKTQKIWIFLWLSLNVLAIFLLIVAEILFFTEIGWWSMTYDPVHVAVFFMVLFLIILLIYGQVIVLTVYLILKDAWLSGILGNEDEEDMAGLTHNGKRIVAWISLREIKRGFEKFSVCGSVIGDSVINFEFRDRDTHLKFV